MQKYFYFRTNAAIADDDDSAASLMVPVDNLLGMHPTSDTAVTLSFTPILRIAGGVTDGADFSNADTVVLNCTTGQAREVMFAIARAANATGVQYSDGVIVVADDATDDNSAAATYLDSNITTCGAIAIAAIYS